MPGFTLRPYQEEAVKAGVQFLKGPAKYNALEVLPTGSGKSLVIANIAKQLDAPTLIFQPSKEILEQNVNKMMAYGYRPGIYSAAVGKKEISQITFATIGSAKNNHQLFEHFKYIIVDECHFVNAKGGMYRDFLDGHGAKVLGMTATPYRLVTDGFGGSILKFLTRTRPRIFRDVIYYIQNGDLFKQGHLAALKYANIEGFDRSKIRLNSTGADFNDLSVKNYYNLTNFQGRVVDAVKGIMQYRKNALVFTRFIDESEHIVKNVQDSAIVTGETPKRERELIIKGFKSGSIKVVCNVGVLTTGFDYPELEAVVLARPTMSLALYYQMIGRCIRPHPEKEFSVVLDLCGNSGLFGKVDDLTLWPGENGKWIIMSNGRQLTNIYYGDRAGA